MGQYRVAGQGDERVRDRHDEAGRAERRDVPGHRPKIPGAMYGQAEFTPPSEVPEHQDRGNELRKDRRDGRAARAESESEDEDRVQYDVENGADGNGQHTEPRVPLRVDERVHARDDHREEGAEQVDPQVGERIGKRGFRGAEQ